MNIDNIYNYFNVEAISERFCQKVGWGMGLLGTSELCTNGFDCLFPTVGVSLPTLILKCVCVIFQVRKEEADEKERRPTDSQAHGRNEILYGDH